MPFFYPHLPFPPILSLLCSISIEYKTHSGAENLLKNGEKVLDKMRRETFWHSQKKYPKRFFYSTAGGREAERLLLIICFFYI